MLQKEFSWYNSIVNLKEILKKKEVKSFFLLTWKTSYDQTDTKSIIEKQLIWIDGVRFSDFEVNPKIEDLERWIEIFQRWNFDIIIVIWWGTVIDMWKMICFFSDKNFSVNDFLDWNIGNRGDKKNKMIAIPTTSGTWAESTHFAVLYRWKTKYSIANENILPDYVFLDAQFMNTIPNHILWPTLLDSLSQCVESYRSVQSTDTSKLYAERWLKTLVEILWQIESLDDLSFDMKQDLLQAANYSWKAINISKTTACHAISYPITSYFNVPHGHAVALTLWEMFIYNEKVDEKTCIDKRGYNYVLETLSDLSVIFWVKNWLEFKYYMDSIILKLWLKNCLLDLWIKKDDLNIVLENWFNPDRVKNNPRILTKKALRVILHNILY